MKKVYINDFCEELNYTDVILYIHEEINFLDLYERLKKDNVGHMYRFDLIKSNRLFYIENCDLQDVDGQELFDLLYNEYAILQLRKDSVGYYVKAPDLF